MKRLHLFVALVVALVSTGCFTASQQIVVEDDGTGTVSTSLRIAADQAVAVGQFTGTGGDSCDVLLDVIGRSGEGIDYGAREDGDDCVLEGSAEFDDLAQARARLSLLVGDAGAVSAQAMSFAPIEEAGATTGWTFSLDYTPIDDAAGVSYEELGPAAELLEFDTASVEFVVRLPGTVVSSNGDSVDDDGTVRWTLEPFENPTTLQVETSTADTATAQDANDGSPAGLIVAGVVGVAVVVALVGVIAARRRT